MESEELTVLDIIQEIMETDRAFYTFARFLDGSTRSSVVLAHIRRTNTALSLARQFLTTPTRTTMVMNIPLNFDASGNFLDPVPVLPTREQINAAVELHVNPEEETTCSICQEAVTCATRIRSCGHCFHGDCIREWFSMNSRCPMCRVDIRDLQSNGRVNSNEGSSLHSDEE